MPGIKYTVKFNLDENHALKVTATDSEGYNKLIEEVRFDYVAKQRNNPAEEQNEEELVDKKKGCFIQ